MLFGGPDTVAATIEWAMAEMIRSPEILVRLQRELADVVGLHRDVDESDLDNAWAIGRVGEAWKDADVFRPSRFMPGEGEAARLDLKGGCYEFLPFGAGRRSCPAQGLGPYAVEFAVATLAHGFDWELPDGMSPAELDMDDLFGVTVSRAKRLLAVPTPRLAFSL
jgi:ferulate-5-hydroxylase